MNSLGFDKDPSRTRVVVAMSGGSVRAVAPFGAERAAYNATPHGVQR
jgi:hypothetical protein